MPLIQSSSKKALGENIAKEISAGKDPKQAAAIAYSVQRQNDDISEKEDSSFGLPGELSISDLNKINKSFWGPK